MAPAMMPMEDLDASIAELPAKMAALREAFDRLAACSPYPLPFSREDLNAHISSMESSISLQFRQIRVLEVARPPHAGKTKAGASEEEEEVEVEEEVEEEEVEEEVEEEEEEEEKEEEKEEDEVVEEEELEKEEEDGNEMGEQEEEGDEVVMEEVADKGMQDANNKIVDQSKDDKEASEDEGDGADEEPVAAKVSVGHAVEAEVLELETDDDEQEEQDAAKEAITEKMTKQQCKRAPPGGQNDLVAACARMDATMLVKFMCCTSNFLTKEFYVAMRRAPDPAAFVLQVVKVFLSSKKFKSNKVWVKCVGLIHWLSTACTKPSGDTIEQAKLVAKDWKKMIDKPECCGEHDLLAAWGLLHFLISYNIVSEFDIHEIIHIFCMVPRKQQKNNTVQLCKSLGLSNRITDLIDYLLGNGKYLEVFHLAHVFSLEDKYPLLSLLKGYIEKAKQTVMEIFGNNNMTHKPLNLVKSKEIENLRVAHHLAKQKVSDSRNRSVIMAEIQSLLDKYSKKRSLPQQELKKQKQSNKKRKKEEQEQHKVPESQPRQEQNQNKVLEGKQQQQHKQENKPQLVQQNQPLKTQHQQHINQTGTCAPKLPTPAIPVVPSVAQIQHFGTMPGALSYPVNPGWPGAQGRPFGSQLGAPQYMGPLYNPFSLLYPAFYPR